MPNTPPNLMANGDIRPSRFVKMDTTAPHKGLEADANESIIGVAQESSNYPPLNDLVTTTYAAQAGEYFRLYGDGDICLVEAGGVVTVGDKLKSDADGRAASIATTGTTLQRYGAIALESATAAGQLIKVQVNLGSERPAIV